MFYQTQSKNDWTIFLDFVLAPSCNKHSVVHFDEVVEY